MMRPPTERHGGDIARLRDDDGRPFRSPADFVLQVSRDFDRVLNDSRRGSILLVRDRPNAASRHSGEALVLGLRRTEEGVYEVLTGGLLRKRYLRNREELWSRERRSSARSAGGTNPSPMPSRTETSGMTALSVRGQNSSEVGTGTGAVHPSADDCGSSGTRGLEEEPAAYAGTPGALPRSGTFPVTGRDDAARTAFVDRRPGGESAVGYADGSGLAWREEDGAYVVTNAHAAEGTRGRGLILPLYRALADEARPRPDPALGHDVPAGGLAAQ